jgi:hypothetical protein
MYTDVFEDLDGCSESSAKDTLNVGAARVVSAPGFNYDPSGHKLRATITLCSGDGQNGTCITNTIKFTP